MKDWNLAAERLHPDIRIALKAATQAGRIIAKGYGRVRSVKEKGVGDLVSDIDRNADEAIFAVLKKHRPEDAVCSEEISPLRASSKGRMWIVDPLDGTAGYIFKAGPQFSCVMIALRERETTVLSVVHNPMTDEWFYAVRGKGAWKNGKHLRIRSVPELARAWVDMNHYGDATQESRAFAELRKKLRTKGGAALVTSWLPHSLSACRIAEGTGPHAVVHDNNQKKVKQGPWDIAAQQLILEEAGGVFRTLKGKLVNPFKAEPFIVAASDSLAQQIRKRAGA
jgi:myo-inositol-1(or 4)-monophosphatase